MSDATHVHVHPHSHAQENSDQPRLSLLTMSAGWRLGGAAIIVAGIWASVLWALHG